MDLLISYISFFFLSGYVFRKKENIWKQIYTSSKSLLLPYVFWNGVAIIYSLIIKEYTLFDGIKKILFIDGVSWNSPVWFFVLLFWSRIFYQILSNKKQIVIPVMCLMAFCSYYGIFYGLPMGIDILPNAIIFFGIGKLLSETEISKAQHFLAIPMLVVSIVGSQLNDRISMYGNYFGNYIIAMIIGISGVVGIFLIIKLITRPIRIFDFLQKIGGYSMNVMCTHYFLLRFLRYLSVSFFNGYDIWHSAGFFKAVVVTTIIFVTEILLVRLFKRLNISDSHIMRV